jgi:hypothetical protein
MPIFPPSQDALAEARLELSAATEALARAVPTPENDIAFARYRMAEERLKRALQ